VQVKDETILVLLTEKETLVLVLPTNKISGALYHTEYSHDGEDGYSELSRNLVHRAFTGCIAYTSYEVAMEQVGRMLAGVVYENGVKFIIDYVDIPFEELNRPEEW
jgi:hypothetical protein